MKKFLCNGKKGFCHDTDNCANCEFCDNSGGEYKEVPLTNADRIRAMSDDEMAGFLTEFAVEAFAAGVIKVGDAMMTEQERFEWLQQPLEED